MGAIAVITLLININTIDRLTDRLGKVESEMGTTKKHLIEPSKDDLIQKNYDDTTHESQTKFQNLDTTSSDEINVP